MIGNMMNKASGYYLYNNPAITMGAIVAMLNSEREIELARITLFLPILLDDNIVAKINKTEYSFENIVALNRLYISNFNERYRDILPLFINALSILLDMDIIILRGEFAQRTNSEFCSSLLENSNSARLQAISIASTRLLKVTRNIDLSKMYYRLNIEL